MRHAAHPAIATTEPEVRISIFPATKSLKYKHLHPLVAPFKFFATVSGLTRAHSFSAKSETGAALSGTRFFSSFLGATQAWFGCKRRSSRGAIRDTRT